MTSDVEAQVIASIKEYVDHFSDKAYDVVISEDKDSFSVRIVLKCKHTEKGLPVHITIDDVIKVINVSTTFFFIIPPLTLYDEYELTKTVNNRIDCFKIIIGRESNKTRVKMQHGCPYSQNSKDIGLLPVQIIERINPSLDLFLAIYDGYHKEADQKETRMIEQGIAVLSQYRKTRPIV